MKLRLVLCSVAVLFASSTGWAQYFEPFDSSAADVKVNSQSGDNGVTYLDYSALGIPEAPRSPAKAAASSGLKLEANITAGAASGVNVLAGATPNTYSGNYRLSYDVWMSFGGSTGTTEQLLWGVGTDDTDPIEARNTRNDGVVGTWGWLAGENGYGTDDAVLFENADELLDLGDTQLFEDVPFNTAFRCDANNQLTNGDPDPPNGAAVFEWVQVDVDVSDNGDGTSNVGVFYNFVEFFNQDVATASVNGFAMLGYEDPFGGSVNDDPANTFGVFDNLHVTMDPNSAPNGTIPEPLCNVPEPSSAILCLLGVACLARRRS